MHLGGVWETDTIRAACFYNERFIGIVRFASDRHRDTRTLEYGISLAMYTQEIRGLFSIPCLYLVYNSFAILAGPFF